MIIRTGLFRSGLTGLVFSPRGGRLRIIYRMHPNSTRTSVNYWITLFALIFVASRSLAQDIDDPTLLITANNVSDSVSILSTDTFSIAIQLDADTSACIEVDWWILVDTPFGFYSYRLFENSWLPGIVPSARDDLFDIAPIEVLNVSLLPRGSYTFYFGIDYWPNGKIDVGQLEYSSVVVEVRK